MAEQPPSTPFQLSRIYAKGWDAGMRCELRDTQTDGEATIDAVIAQAETLNPCSSEIDRAKWMQGFTEAVRRKFDGPQRRKKS